MTGIISPSSDKEILKEILQRTLSTFIYRILNAPISIQSFVLAQRPDTLAASSLINPTMANCIIVMAAPFHSLSSLFARELGKGDNKALVEFYRSGMWITLLSSILGSGLVFAFPPLLIACNAPGNTSGITQEYLRAALPGILLTLWVGPAQTLMLTKNLQKYAIIANFLGVLVLVGAGILLSLGVPVGPKLGAAGVGYAFSLSSFAKFLMTHYFMWKDEFLHQFTFLPSSWYEMRSFFSEFRTHWQIYKPRLIEIYSHAFPVTVLFLSEMGLLLATALIAGHDGEIGLSVHHVVVQYFGNFLILWFSFLQTLNIKVGVNFGESLKAGKSSDEISLSLYEARKFAHAGIEIAGVVGLLSIIVTCLIPRPFSKLYVIANNSNREIILEKLQTSLRLAAAISFFDGIRNTVFGISRAVNEVKIPIYLNAAIVWCVAIPLASALTYGFQLEIEYLHASMLLAFGLSAITLFFNVHKLIDAKFPIRTVSRDPVLDSATGSSTEISTVTTENQPASYFNHLFPFGLFKLINRITTSAEENSYSLIPER